MTVDGRIVLPKGASLYDRLEEAKTSGTFTGRSELRLALNGNCGKVGRPCPWIRRI